MFPKVIEAQVRAELDEVFGDEPVIKHVQGFTVRFDETLDDDDTDDLIDHVDRLPGGVLIADQDGYGIGVLCDATGTSMVPSVARHLTGWFEAHNLAITELHARLILRRDIV